MSDDAVRWSQRQCAMLCDVAVPTARQDSAAVYEAVEFEPERTVRNSRMVQVKGAREVLARERSA